MFLFKVKLKGMWVQEGVRNLKALIPFTAGGERICIFKTVGSK
jgi:hypothetical protein